MPSKVTEIDHSHDPIMCSICTRSLYLKDGPTCPECLVKEEAKKLAHKKL